MVHLSRRHLRVAVGVLWLLDAALQTRPQCFTPDWWRHGLAETVMGQPATVAHIVLWATRLLSAHAPLANSLAIAIQAAIGLCLVSGRLERAAIAASVPWAGAVWWVGEGLGALPTGFAQLAGGAPGPVIFYPLVAILAWPKASTSGHVEQPVAARFAYPAWSAVWLGGALLELPWRVPAAQALRANIEQNSLDQPRWLASVGAGTYRLAGAHPHMVPPVLFLAQLAIGVGVVGRQSRPPALAAGAVLALLFWVTVQGLGGMASGAATDPGSGLLLVLFALAAASARPLASKPKRAPNTWHGLRHRGLQEPDRTPLLGRSRPRRLQIQPARSWCAPLRPLHARRRVPHRVLPAGPARQPGPL